MGNPPAHVVRLAEERAEARHRRDFARADALRRSITEAGWEVIDGGGGFRLEAATRPVAVSVLLDDRRWPADATRLVDSLERHADAASGEVQLVSIGPEPGFAAARNGALRQAEGDIVVVVDTSLELTGPLFPALTAALSDPAVAVAGPFGLASTDLCDYEERTDGDVVAVQGYCLAARRADLVAAGGYRETFAFYRNADIDLSLRLRTQGDNVRRAVAVGEEHCRRHLHRDWEGTAPEERDRLSRRNMRRVLDRFAGRAGELAVP